MWRPRFKEKCKICRKNWVVARPREYTICVGCHMRQIFSEDIEDKKYKFLDDVDKETYEKSKFLRNIRGSYIMYKDLTEKQISAFKKAAADIKAGKPFVPPEQKAAEEEKKSKKKKKKGSSPTSREIGPPPSDGIPD